MLRGFDENFDHTSAVNKNLYETFFVDGEVLHEGIVEWNKLHPDPSLRIITRLEWDKKAAGDPNAKAPPKAKQSKNTRPTNPAKTVAAKRSSRSSSTVLKGKGKAGACKAMGMDCGNKSSPNQTTKCLECSIWVHPKKPCSVAKGTSFVCDVCWNKSEESDSSSESSKEKPPPPKNETHKKPQSISSSNDSSTEGEEEIQGGEKDNASGEGKEEEEDEATVVDTEDEDSPPGGHCFRCRRLCSSAPELKTIRVDGKLRMFDQRCHGMFEAGIEHPTPPKSKEVEEKESSRKPTALRMGDVEATGQCEAMGENCQWQDIAVTAECVSCSAAIHVMCGVKFDDGEGLEDEACYKCHNCNDVKQC